MPTESGARGGELLRRRWLLRLGRLCVHRSDVLGALSRAEVDSKHRLRGLALEGVHGLGEYRAQPRLNARHGPQETSNRAWAGVGAVLLIIDRNSSELRVSRRLRSYELLPAAEFPFG